MNTSLQFSMPELDELKIALSEKNIKLVYTDAAAQLIAKRAFSRKYGARNMRRFIQKEVEDRLAAKIIADYKRFYSYIKIDADENGEITVQCM